MKYTVAELNEMGLQADMPRHVGIIMDGNGRWAAARGLPRTLGHRAGVERLRGIIKSSSDLGIGALSLYAFSTENWRRPSLEVNALFKLFIEFFNRELDNLCENQVKITALGDMSKFPEEIANSMMQAELRTKHNAGLKLSIAMNYGSRAEILNVVKRIAAEVASGKLDIADIDDEYFAQQLYTAGLPDLDFLIRTSGEQRLSNFLLYQAAYAEILFVPEYWPDFTDESYINALKEYQRRSRRYGGLK